jgi:hypothetical protein
MTFTAMRPVAGLGNGREMSLLRVDPGVLVDLGLQRGLERLVGVVRSVTDVGEGTGRSRLNASECVASAVTQV